HAYPTRASLLSHKRKLGEILVGWGDLAAPALAAALAECPSGTRLGDYLVRQGAINVTTLYSALAFQQGLPIADVDPREVPWAVAHGVPEGVVKQWQVLPFRVAHASLYVVSPEAPSAEAAQALASSTSLEIRFHLATPAEFAKLTSALL